jgi:hypothetical protein
LTWRNAASGVGASGAEVGAPPPNLLDDKPARTMLRMVAAQITDFMILILIAAAGFPR